MILSEIQRIQMESHIIFEIKKQLKFHDKKKNPINPKEKQILEETSDNHKVCTEDDGVEIRYSHTLLVETEHARIATGL